MRRQHGIAAAIGIVALTLLVTCSDPASDGESCEDNSDCKSGRCGGGVCAGSDCKCEGTDCRARSTCSEGWLCTRSNGAQVEPIPLCRQQCTGAGTCPAGKHCENAVCSAGAEPFTLTWLNIPRTRPCSTKVPCDYRLRPPEVAVSKYTWTFGTGRLETTEPTASFTYEKDGAYDVVVRAEGRNGAVADLKHTEILCSGVLGATCNSTGASCCAGTCNVMGVCK